MPKIMFIAENYWYSDEDAPATRSYDAYEVEKPVGVPTPMVKFISYSEYERLEAAYDEAIGALVSLADITKPTGLIKAKIEHISKKVVLNE